jgi:hypothetical protein
MTPKLTSADHELLRQVSAWPGPTRLRELDPETLCQISRTRGIDFATALLYDTIRKSPEHGPFIARMEELLHDQLANRCDLDAALAVAPGAFYREHPETGADGKALCRMAAAMGCRTKLIPTESVGSAMVNGRVMCDWLLRESKEKTILCSLSKGGADVKMALAEPDAAAAFRNVVAWLNVGGITAGSPMATWLVERRLLALVYQAIFWWRGQEFAFVRELVRRPGSTLDFKVCVPPHIKVIHVLGFPLEDHVRRRPSGRWHRRLSCYGPNDGATVLADHWNLPGLIFPLWGEDHYLNTQQSPERLFKALLHYLADELNLFARPARNAFLAESSAAK